MIYDSLYHNLHSLRHLHIDHVYKLMFISMLIAHTFLLLL